MEFLDDAHAEVVSSLQKQIREFHRRGQGFRVFHGITHTSRSTVKDGSCVIDTSNLTRMLGFTLDTVVVEANVSMAQLFDACVETRRIPLVTIEIPKVTAGGAFCGTSGESSSFRHGLFYETVCGIEVICADGHRRILEKTTDSDLFYSFANSYGTLGVVTALQIKTREAKSYVRLTYTSVKDAEQAAERFEILRHDPTADFLEGIMFGHDRGVICRGRLSNKAEGESLVEQTFNQPYDP